MSKAHPKPVQCKAKTAQGKPCRMAPLKGSAYCFNHDPAAAAQRAKARKAGGESRHTPHFADPVSVEAELEELEKVSPILAYIWKETAGMDNSHERSRVLLAIHERYIKTREATEWEARLKALEERTK
jgi:hypothetical protein